MCVPTCPYLFHPFSIPYLTPYLPCFLPRPIPKCYSLHSCLSQSHSSPFISDMIINASTRQSSPKTSSEVPQTLFVSWSGWQSPWCVSWIILKDWRYCKPLKELMNALGWGIHGIQTLSPANSTKVAEVATGSLPCVVLSQARSRREDLQQVAGHLFFQDMSMFVPLLLLNVQKFENFML